MGTGGPRGFCFDPVGRRGDLQCPVPVNMRSSYLLTADGLRLYTAAELRQRAGTWQGLVDRLLAVAGDVYTLPDPRVGVSYGDQSRDAFDALDRFVGAAERTVCLITEREKGAANDPS